VVNLNGADEAIATGDAPILAASQPVDPGSTKHQFTRWGEFSAPQGDERTRRYGRIAAKWLGP
jgi:hypothetical protein